MSSPAPPTRRATVLAALLWGGAIGVVLAVMDSPIFDLDRHAVPKELALHLTALLGLAALCPGRRRLEAGVVETLLGGYVAWSAVSALAATNHWLALRTWGVSFAGLVVFVMARAARREGRGRLVLAGLAAAATAGALTGVLQAYGVDWGLLRGERAPGGTLGNRNFLAHLATIALPVAGVLGLEARRRWTAAMALAAVGILAGAIVLTRSRAAWLAGMACVAVTSLGAWAAARRSGWVTPRRRRVLVAAAAVGVAAAVGLPNRLSWTTAAPYRESLAGLVNYQEGSGRGRLIQYRNSLRLVVQDPVFGTGPGNWMIHYPRVTTPGDPSFAGADPIPTNPWPSSDWVATVVERGPIGALVLLLAGLAAALIAVRRLGDPALASDSLAALGVLTAVTVTGLFDAVLLLAPPTLMTFAALGALLPVTGAPVSRELRGGWGRAIRLAPLLIALALVVSSAGQTAAIRLTQAGRRRDAMREALRYDPGNHRLHLILGMRGDCGHARKARALLPYHPWAEKVARGC